MSPRERGCGARRPASAGGGPRARAARENEAGAGGRLLLLLLPFLLLLLLLLLRPVLAFLRPRGPPRAPARLWLRGEPRAPRARLRMRCSVSLGRKIKTFATKMVITSGNDDDRGGQEKESKEESILAMLGIIGTILNLIVIIFVYIYTTL